MDIEIREYFWLIIENLKEDNWMIFYILYYIEEVECMLDKIIFIENGEIKFNDLMLYIRIN